jgi:hypothetical protein
MVLIPPTVAVMMVDDSYLVEQNGRSNNLQESLKLLIYQTGKSIHFHSKDGTRDYLHESFILMLYDVDLHWEY